MRKLICLLLTVTHGWLGTWVNAQRYDNDGRYADGGLAALAAGHHLPGADTKTLTLLRLCLASPACSQALSTVAANPQQDPAGLVVDSASAGTEEAAAAIRTAATSATPLNLRDIDETLAAGVYHGEDLAEGTRLSIKALAALVLLVEAAAGMYLPLLLQRLQSPQWWLSLLNCFSGGIFLAAGIIHLLPHCAEAQEALGPVGPGDGDYPLYLVLVVVGYLVVFYVERVLFDVHGEGHWHCQHSNVFSHSSYYKAISHRPQRPSVRPQSSNTPATATATATAGLRSADSLSEGHARGPQDGAAAHPLRLSHMDPQSATSGPAGCSRAGSGAGAGCDADGGTAGGSGGGGRGGHQSAAPAAIRHRIETRAPPGDLLRDGSPDLEAGYPHQHQHQHHNHACQGASCDGPTARPAPLPPALARPSCHLVLDSPGGSTAASAVTCEEYFANGAGAEAPGELALAGAGKAEEDAESCHSEHAPRAMCVCVEVAEEVSVSGTGTGAGAGVPGVPEGRARQHGGHETHKHQHGHHHEHSHHRHAHSRQESPRRPARSGSGGRDGGHGESLLAPLLETSFNNAEGGVGAAPFLPPLPLPGGGPASDLARSAAWQHLQQQHQQHLHLLQLQEQGDEEDQGGQRHPHGPRHRAHSALARPHALHRRAAADHAAAAAAVDGGDCSALTPLLAHDHHHHNGHSHGHGHGAHVHHGIKPRFRFMHGVVLLVVLALHTALECIALGLVDERSQFTVLFVAIASHKMVSALALSSRFLKEGANMWQVTAYVGPFCLVAPLSILAGVYVGRVAPLARLVFSCFATGTFLYVGASEVIMEEFEGEMRADRRDISTRAARYIKFAAVVAAVGLVAASALLPDADH